MPFEIDVLAVGEGERSGDAIAVRFGSPGAYQVMVYDGGTQTAGEALVQHVRTHYQTNRVDYVVNSHPDTDHASGLSVVLTHLDVGQLWIHRPWTYSRAILQYFRDGRLTSSSLSNRLKEEMSAAHSLEQLAILKGIPVYEPFQGAQIGPFFVLSPKQDWYVHTLIPEFEKSPMQKSTAGTSNLGFGLARGMTAAALNIYGWVAEQWGYETLRETSETSAENESSVILYGEIDDKGILLTGDGGIRALSAAANRLASCGVSLPGHLRYVQVPHHGSRHNVSMSVLDRLVGARKFWDDGVYPITAFASVGAKSTTHPRKAVVNAFMRRGARVYQTKSMSIWFGQNMPARGWAPIEGLPFSDQVEVWE